MRTLDRQFMYDKVYMKMAEDMGSLSYAERKKVGAIIVSKDDQIISQGYNGTPTGWSNICETLDPITRRLVTVPECLHAESNAISKCAKLTASTKDSTIYVTLSPCIECAKLIIQSGISRVVFKEVYRNTDGLILLDKCGIKVEMINMDFDKDSSWYFEKNVDNFKKTEY